MNNDQRLTTVISFALMLATMALGWFTLSDRLSFPKIATDRVPGQASPSEQDVIARLWEDPLQAVQAEANRVKDGSGHAPENLSEAVRRKLTESNGVCLLLVTISGTPFPDDIETRLRLRHSVQMAMAHQDYSPEDRDHLGYVRLDWPGPEGVHDPVPACVSPSPVIERPATNMSSGRNLAGFGTAFSKQATIPYEWFVPRQPARPGVLVLWLPESLLGQEPLCRLAYLRQLLAPPERLSAGQLAGLFVIGPRSSDTLKQIVLADFPAERHVCSSLLASKLCLFSSQATAPDALIHLAPTNLAHAARADLEGRLRRLLSSDSSPAWTYFHNFIAPDDQLTDLLVPELALRGVSFTNRHDRVLILAEADTSYGRSLPLAFQASVSSYLGGGLHAGKSPTPVTLTSAFTNTSGMELRLTIARYLRGLDAQKGFQGQEQGGAGKTKSAEQLLAEALNRKASPALGDSQLDYVERLAGVLADQGMRDEVKAVGVLGGDIYDKLVLLRSLRLRFPEALFFTTDLDARLWDPDHLKFTRNLVVASAHDVHADTHQAGFRMAPFRDVYQATAFNACVAALRTAGNAPVKTGPVPTPELYEIGRNGAVQLERPGSGLAGRRSSFGRRLLTVGQHLQEGWIRAKQTTAGWARSLWSAVFWFLVGGVLGLVLLLRGDHPGSNRLGLCHFTDVFRARTGWVAGFLVLTIAAMRGFALATQGMQRLPGAEPWSWSDGVSIWPTELVRLFTGACVLWMLCWAWQSHGHHCRALAERYHLSPPTGDAGGWTGWKELWRRIRAAWPEPSRTNDPVTAHWINANGVFQTYLLKAGLGARVIRVAIGAIVYFCFALGIMLLGGLPFNTHIRGEVARTLDSVILIFSIMGLLALVFYVLDAVWLSAQMLNRIARPFTKWPQPLLDKHAADLGVGDDDLEGYLDVQFAAENTRQVGRLVFLPFLIQFLMLVSRNSYFDNWSWPPGLVFIFISNMLLAAAAWAILRCSAAKLRDAALDAVNRNLRGIECGAAPQPGVTPTPPPAARRLGLQEIKRRVEQERRGAYARWIQDPAFLAMMIPTGLLGVLSVLFQALFGFM